MDKWIITFSTNNRIYLRVVMILALITLFVVFKSESPKVRQPMNVGRVQLLSKPFQLKKKILSAKKSAEHLDHQVSHLMTVNYMSGWGRWRADIDIDRLKIQFSRDLVAHLQAMTSLMKFRREEGGFKKLREFDFQNMVRKSDYLIGLPISKSSLQSLEGESYWQTVLENYNHERRIFDAKKIVIAEY